MHRPAQGMTLIDALLAALILALGMLGAAQFQRTLRLHADTAAERSLAVRLAQQSIERLRNTADLSTLSDRNRSETIGAAGTVFAVDEQPGAIDGSSRALAVAVAWTDRRGDAQRVTLATVLTESSADVAGALLHGPAADTVSGAHGRSARVPLTAADLGDGRSAWQPVTTAPETWIVDNRNASVLERCAGPGATSCDGQRGTLVTGTVRFATGATPDPAAADDTPLPALPALFPTGPGFERPAHCTAQIELSGGQRGLRWQCIVYPAAGSGWSGRIDVLPQGWVLGFNSGDYRVCRYSADTDASGTIDRNAEHPLEYQDVRTTLPHQNFIVVRGNQPCPAATAAILDPTPNGTFADLSTADHQP